MIILDKGRVAEKIEKRISEDVQAGRVGGASVLVKQNGETIYRNVFGNACEGRALTSDTVFRLASMTKPVTGVAIMRQIEKGLVSLDDTLDKFIPEYENMDIARVTADNGYEIVGKAKNKIKILHLLTHTSGIACGGLGNVLAKGRIYKNGDDLKTVTDEYASRPISFEPYSEQAYSALLGFDILARVVEITSGMPFAEYLKKEILEPLGMNDTSFTPTNGQWDRMVSMHNLVDGKVIFYPVDREHIFAKLPLTYHCGGAGLVSTVSDYEKFADMLLLDGVGANGNRIISEEAVRLMRTPAVPESVMPGSQRWGLSMRVITDPSYARLPVGAYGWSGAFGTHFWVDPANGIVGIYMKNSHYDGGSGALTAANFERDVYL